MSSNTKKSEQTGLVTFLKMVNPRDPAWIFLGLTLLVGMAIVVSIVPPGFLSSSGKLMNVTIEHQKKDIAHIDQTRETFATDTFYIDTIDFPAGNTLRHEKLGDYDFSRNFFVRIEGQMVVNTPGEYRMIVASDDGFRLEIDGQRISQHTNDRPMAETVTNVRLEKGKHSFVVSWFQGFGQLGLRAWYEGTCGRKLFGESTPCITFVSTATKD